MTIRKNRDALEKIEWMRNLLAFLLVGSFVLFAGLLLWKAIPKDNEQLLSYMLGQISGMAIMALGFYFVNKVGQDALDAKRADNTGKMADAIVAASGSGSITPDVPQSAVDAADLMVDAAADKRDEIAGEGKGAVTPPS